MNILIKDVLAIVPENAENKIIPANIYIQNDKIVSMDKQPVGFTADKVINGENRLAIPGLINCHTHSYMSLFRNVADDLSFGDWLFGNVMPLEDKLEPNDAYWGALLAICEMMKSGTTCFSDMQMHIGKTTKAASDAGMRAVISRGLVGSGNDEAGSVRIKEAFTEMEMFKDNPLLTFMLGPHAPYTCDEEFLKIVAKTAKDNKLGVHIHLSESETEIENCQNTYGCTPIELANRAGLFDVPCVAAHCVQVTDGDIKILSEKNVSAATNPASNMKLGNGFAPLEKMLDGKVNVCIGTDGAASNNGLNMFREMGFVSLIHKGKNRTAQCINASETFDMATKNAAKALGLSDKIGTLEVGKNADIAILNLNTPSLTPRNNLIAGLCYSANGSEVETVIINGNITVENGKMTMLDEQKVYSEIARICKRLGIG